MFADSARNLSSAPSSREPMAIVIDGKSCRLVPSRQGNTLSWRYEGELQVRLGGRLVSAELRLSVSAVDPAAPPLPRPVVTPGL